MKKTALRRRKNLGWTRIRRDSLRALWADVVKHRDRFTCRRCGRKKADGWQLHGAHILGAGAYPALKYETANGLTLCARDHLWAHNHTEEFQRWAQGEIGVDRYTKLLVLANTMRRLEKTEIRLVLREELRRVKAALAL